MNYKVDFYFNEEQEVNYLTLTGEICQEMLHDILKLCHRGDFKKENGLVLVLNSSGGDLYSAFGIYDILKKAIKKKVSSECVCIGEVLSAATIIMCAFDRVIAYLNTTFLFHRPEIENGFTPHNNVKAHAEHVSSLNVEMLNIYGRKIKNNMVYTGFEQEYNSGDLYLTSYGAMRYGFINKVIE